MLGNIEIFVFLPETNGVVDYVKFQNFKVIQMILFISLILKLRF